MKKLFAACVLILTCSCCACAEGLKIGILSRVASENKFNANVNASWRWSVERSHHTSQDRYIFFSDSASILMALESGEIDESNAPDIIAEYITLIDPSYEICCSMRVPVNIGFSFGFHRVNADLCNLFNKTLAEMRADRTLDRLEFEYLVRPLASRDHIERFESFLGARTIKVAVTGDIPPLDYFTPHGKPSGFSTAILAEIGRRLKLNITLVNVHTDSRVASLMSGRADVVFWFILGMFDSNENIMFSMPYYTFNTFLHIRKK